MTTKFHIHAFSSETHLANKLSESDIGQQILNISTIYSKTTCNQWGKLYSKKNGWMALQVSAHIYHKLNYGISNPFQPDFRPPLTSMCHL